MKGKKCAGALNPLEVASAGKGGARKNGMRASQMSAHFCVFTSAVRSNSQVRAQILNLGRAGSIKEAGCYNGLTPRDDFPVTEVLNQVCPSTWRGACKTAVQLLFGQAGLVSEHV